MVKGGELTVSRLRLPGRAGGGAVVDGQAAQRDGDLVLLGELRTLKAGDRLAIELNPNGKA
jgi:hypothetical protein